MQMKYLMTVLIAIVLMPTWLLAASSLSTQIPSTFSDRQSTIGAMGVGQACLTMFNIEDGLPCNPAFLARKTKGTFLGQATVGNSYDSIATTTKLLNGKFDQELVKSLFDKNQVIEMQANAEMTFMAPHFAAQFIPYKLYYFSVVRNQAYPTVAIHALQERSYNFQAGFEPQQGLLIGLQTRFIERKFLNAEFDAYEIAAEDGHRILEPKEQRSILIEPALTYILNVPWRPRISLMGRNLGFIDNHYDVLVDHPQAEVGVGISPHLKYGRLELGIDYRPHKIQHVFSEELHYGASYKIGHMTTVMGLSSDTFTGGFLFGIESIGAGIIYSTTRTPFTSSDEYVQSIYSQFAVKI